MIAPLIQAYKRALDQDGELHLDRQQALYLEFFLQTLLDNECELRDCVSLRFAVMDLLGVLPSGREERGA